MDTPRAILALGLLLAACDPPAPSDPCAGIAETARRVMDEERAAAVVYMPGMIFSIDSPACGRIEVASGLATLEPEAPMTPDLGYQIASETKMFVGAVIMQLVDEGAIGLDDTVDAWFPDFPRSSEITIRQLLAHTSGIPDYFSDTDCERLHQNAPSTPEQLVACEEEAELLFEPGTDVEYSSTGYVMLGLVIEAETGVDLDEAIRARLLEPLGLEQTGSLLDPTPAPTRMMRAYGAGADVTDEWDDHFFWAAGHMVSTADDMTTWIRELVTGDVVSPESRAAMIEQHDTGTGWTYGLAIEGDTVVDNDGETVCTLVGHDGRGRHMSEAYYVPEWDAVVVLATNERYSPGAIQLPNRALDRILTAIAPALAPR